MEKITVLVVGGRIIPHFCPIWSDPPDRVKIVGSSDSKDQYALVKNVLARYQPQITVEDPAWVAANDLAGTREECLKIGMAHPRARILFDVTSGTKLMSFGAYQAAEALRCPVIFVDSTNAKVINVMEGRTVPFRVDIKVDAYLAFWGRECTPNFDPAALPCGDVNARMAALALGRSTVAHRVLLRTRQAMDTAKRQAREARLKVTNPPPAPDPWPFYVPYSQGTSTDQNELQLLRRLQSLGLIDGLHQGSDGFTSFRVLTGSDWKFLSGTWLEYYLYLEAARLKDADGLFFDSVKFSILIPQDDAKREIDLGCTRNAQFILASCKTEAEWFQKSHLDELAAVRRLVGDRYSTALYITSGIPPAPSNSGSYSAYTQFLAHAHQQQIVTLTGQDLPGVGEILRREMLTPTYPRR